MHRVEWREGGEIHFKEYRVVGIEGKAESVLEKLNVPPVIRDKILKTLDIFNGELVLIDEKVRGTNRRKILWEREDGTV